MPKYMGSILLLGDAFRMTHYSDTILHALACFWAVGSLVLARFVQRRSYAYWASVGLAVPGLAYSMLGHGLVEMGGIVHALAAGLYVLPFHFLFRCSRERGKHRA
jgi:hypothetical protein